MLAMQIAHLPRALAFTSDGGTGLHQQHRPSLRSAQRKFKCCPAASASSVKVAEVQLHESTLPRRALLLGASFACCTILAHPHLALAEDDLQAYTDIVESFVIDVPQGWMLGTGTASGNKGFTGATGARRALAWFPEGDTSSSVTVVVTNVGADYTGMGSFGTAEQFGQNLVNSMDRSYLLRGMRFGQQLPPEGVQVAKLLNTKELSKRYYVDYSVQQGDGPLRLLQSVACMSFNGRYNRLYTVTAQCLEANAGAVQDLLARSVASFRPPPSLAY